MKTETTAGANAAKAISSGPIEDEEIKAVARHNRRRAFDMVLLKYRDRLMSHANHLLRNSDDAFEITQETFIRAYQEPSFFNDDFRIKAWLFRVVTNLSYNHTRDTRRRGGILQNMAKAPRAESVLVLDQLMQRETERTVVRALDRVPEKYRTILRLKYYQDMSYNEISEKLGCRLGTVMSRLSRARDRFQASMALEQGYAPSTGA